MSFACETFEARGWMSPRAKILGDKLLHSINIE